MSSTPTRPGPFFSISETLAIAVLYFFFTMPWAAARD
jgi:hypothetical protein